MKKFSAFPSLTWHQPENPPLSLLTGPREAIVRAASTPSGGGGGMTALIFLKLAALIQPFDYLI